MQLVVFFFYGPLQPPNAAGFRPATIIPCVFGGNCPVAKLSGQKRGHLRSFMVRENLSGQSTTLQEEVSFNPWSSADKGQFCFYWLLL